jgi:hypothetical protein
MILVDVRVQLEHVQVIRSKIGPELDRNWFGIVEMFKMSQFEPISRKKLRVFT